MGSIHTNLLYHVVFSTKLRKPLINADFKEELFRYIGGIIRGEGGRLLEINGMPDHLHLLVKLKPAVALSDMMRKIKSNSSKWLNDEKIHSRGFGWQDGFSAFRVSESQMEHVAHYIREQEAHHQKSDFKTELKALLKRHGVEFDETYLWN